MGYVLSRLEGQEIVCRNSEGQFVMNFGEAEKSMIENLESAIINITEVATSDEKRMGRYMEYLVD